MSEQLNSTGFRLSGAALRTWGMLLLLLGMIGRSIFQRSLLGLAAGSQLLELLNSSPSAMGYATVAIILQLLEACAAPVFSFLLVEGFLHTKNFKRYLVRVLAVALISEVPYDFMYSGSFLNLDVQNPVFAVALCLMVLYFLRYYREKTIRNRLIQIVVFLAALAWTGILNIQDGGPLLIITVVLWIFREKSLLRTLAGCLAAVVSMLFSPFYLIAPLSFLMIHWYRGERGNQNRVVSYLMYPVLLTITGLIGYLL